MPEARAGSRAMTPQAKLAQRFWRKVGPRHEGECWNWTGARGSSGRGQIWVVDRLVTASRVAFFLTYERWPVSGCLHSCDNPICVNPAHLHEGTQKQNMEEAKLRGRTARGSRHAAAKLTELQVCGVMARWLQGETQTQIAKSLGVPKMGINNIVTGRTWKHVFEIEEETQDDGGT